MLNTGFHHAASLVPEQYDLPHAVVNTLTIKMRDSFTRKGKERKQFIYTILNLFSVEGQSYPWAAALRRDWREASKQRTCVRFCSGLLSNR